MMIGERRMWYFMKALYKYSKPAMLILMSLFINMPQWSHAADSTQVQAPSTIAYHTITVLVVDQAQCKDFAGKEVTVLGMIDLSGSSANRHEGPWVSLKCSDL